MATGRYDAVAAALKAIKPDYADYDARPSLNPWRAAMGAWLTAVAAAADVARHRNGGTFDVARFDDLAGKDAAAMAAAGTAAEGRQS